MNHSLPVPSVTVAIEPYDRHLPLLERRWSTDSGITLDFKLVGQLAQRQDGDDRHRRFLHEREFDIAEFSVSSYFLYRQTREDLTALPVFPRRMSSFSHVWVRQESPYTSWKDLASSVVGVPAFQMSLAVVARADMAAVEGVSWLDITWATTQPENVELDSPVRRVEAPSLFEALQSGEIDAILTPEVPGGPNFLRIARRLYGSRAAELDTQRVRQRGFVPIVHLLAAHNSVLERNPSLVTEVVSIFSQAHRVAREWYNDPAWGLLYWGRQELERQEAAMGHDGWPQGLESNRGALQDFYDAAIQQGILERPLDVRTLFASDVSH